MIQTSIIIPSCNEKFLQPTITGILSNTSTEIEVIAYLDGYWPDAPLINDKRLVIIHDSARRGMRAGINAAASIARGKYLCKLDGHCIVDKGFDKVLADNCDDNWVCVPRRYSLDGEKWERENNGKIRDAHYLSYPTAFGADTYLGFGLHVKDWFERGKARTNIPIDDDMTSQGSCWFMHRKYFQPLEDRGYGTFIQEMQEIGLRAWLTGGRLVVNKNTWYAHLWKGKKWGRMYDLSRAESKLGEIFSADRWFNNSALKNRVHNFEWLVDKFWPVPTWPENWKDLVIDFPKVVIQCDGLPKEKPIVMETPAVISYETTVNYLLKKLDRKLTTALPIEIDYNRRFWGRMFNELGFKKGAEIGVYAGQYSEKLCIENPGVEHWCIDPWLEYEGRNESISQKRYSLAEEEARKRLSKYNCKFIKAFSMDAVKQFEDNSLDYVYIDGNHDFQNVTNDIVEWEKKVRPGGIVAGHDFDLHRFKSRCHVLQAVTGYTAAVGTYPWFITSKACRIEEPDSPTAGDWMTSWMWVKS